MLNLVPVHKKSLRDISPLPLVAFTVDPDDQLVCAFEQDGLVEICVRNFRDGQEWQRWDQWPVESEILTIMADFDGVVCVLKNGDIVEATSEGASIVGGFDTPILAAQWSPDQEVLCLAIENKIMMLSRQFDLLGECSFTPDDLKLSKHVSVGWGKKETQFQGRGAHALRDPTMPEKVDTGILCDDEQMDIHISWCGDGSCVAVSAIESERRVFRVFERNGTLSSVSEPCDYLDSILSFQPRGAVIAAIQQEPHQVVFFEKNGLRRYEFALHNSEKVLQLDWSTDSDILAIRYDTRIDLWTQKNYHWYRKSSVFEPGLHAKSMTFHPVLARTLLVEWNDGSIGTFSFVSSICEHNGHVAVIDYDQILVTDLAKAVIPPPFSQKQLAVRQPTHVAVGPGKVAAVSTNTIEVFSGGSAESLAVDGQARLVAFSPDGRLGYTAETEFGPCFIVENAAPIAADIVTLVPGFYQTLDGAVWTWDGVRVATFSRPCPRFVAASETQFFGLTRSNQLLYANANGTCEILAQGVTSIASGGPELLLLTTLNYLKFIHLNNEIVVPEESDDSEQVRLIERGSFLVSVLPAQMSVVLEHPRGNLETIFPRMLVVNAVRRMIEDTDYGQAFTVCRKHRVDLNLIYDYDPKKFMANLPSVVSQIGTSERIDLLISGLRDDDVTIGKYRATVNAPNSGDGRRPGKINEVCDALIPHLTTKSKLTALACKVPPQLETALQLCENESDLRHLCFLMDADLLYNTALGMYDLQLALAVAQQAQKDPKEYLSFLRAREAEGENRRKFAIDDYLRRYERALPWLLVPGVAEDSEVLVFVEAHDLHAQALSLPILDDVAGRRAQVLSSQAAVFSRLGEYAAAGLNYELIDEVKLAFDAYVRAGAWQRALSLDSTPNATEEVADALVRQEKWAAAAQVYYYHLHDALQAIYYYCNAFLFDEAVLCANKNADLLEKVDNGLREQFGSIQELFADCAAQVNSQLRRLRDVRAQRAQDMLGYGMAGLTVADDASIAGTETTVAASYMTRYTDKTGGTAQTGASRRTQKNRRREERKKARGRKGTVYEEEYLIASTSRLIERLIHTRPSAKLLADGLKRRKMNVHYDELLSGFKQVLDILSANVEEIYNVPDKDLERYTEDGELFLAPRPICPALPTPLP